ncbi:MULTISPECIES: InlB B-repeat-containing protein [unclassified Enterococcus]|uniref:InlB B-repeat-containing protein n=1 Tax=unclassified Enterococcus TaxID=2608891 RepID=UPI001557FCA4|nr:MULTISPECIES: InlB B-repeat-containing protein [unclassified Enterococcus]MBS7578058.1 InlB B-repeat-containing protein [Enterococcus sp. MMGLQ5-2]MBS7585252.1 InlB B-repeat-containing protein [Enterococcus sp. MMGLQ5-1]NPD13109.1 InlB B-repeat-containing protein [Enterococcus sp. MMGLQ5-1]NPD37889.1 InlB B-repeat-containing protein [Enterococcus sp. MMGLQ5-2]
MKKGQIKQGVCFGLAVSVLALVLVLIKPELASAYDVVDDIVTVTAEDGTDFNAIYNKYKEHSIIELPAGTYTLSDSLVINDPVIIRAAGNLSAADIIIDGGAKEETAGTDDEVWQAHLKLIHDALSGETVDYQLIERLIPMALVKYPQSETGRGARLWSWVKTSLLALNTNYKNEGYNQWNPINQEELGEIPFQIKQSIRYKRGAQYFNENKAAILSAFEVAFPSSERSELAFKHQLHMDNAYAMLQGVTLQHFMGFQMFNRNQQLIDTHDATNTAPTSNYYDELMPTYASAISINGSIDRVKVTKNFMADILAVDTGSASNINNAADGSNADFTNRYFNKLYYRKYNGNSGWPSWDMTDLSGNTAYGDVGLNTKKYEQTIDSYNELPSPIFLVNGGSVSNSVIAYNGSTFFKDEGTITGNFLANNTVNGSQSTVKIGYNAGDFVAMASYGYARLTNNTIVNNNAKWNFLSINGDLVMQNNILLTLTTDGNYQSGAGQIDQKIAAYYNGDTSYYTGDKIYKNRIYDLRYQAGGNSSLRFYSGGNWSYYNSPEYYPKRFVTEAGLVNEEKDFTGKRDTLDGLFTNVPNQKTGYRNKDGSLNEALSYDLTPISDAFVDQGVDCYYPQVGKDINGNARILGTKPDLGAIEATGTEPSWAIGGVTDDFYITEDGAGNKDGSSWENAYAGSADIQYGIILAHRAGAKNVHVGAGDFKVQGKPYLYAAYANGFVTTVWDGVILAPVADSLTTDTTIGMNFYGKLDSDGNPETKLIGQQSAILKTQIGTFPYEANFYGRYVQNGYSYAYNNDSFRFSWGAGEAAHTARTTYGTRVVSQVEPVKGTIEGVVVSDGYVATAQSTQQSPRWTISEELANHNLAKGGGGVYLWNGTIKNSIIKNNYEARAFINQLFSCGGGIFLNDSSAMENTKVVNNFSETTGGGVLAAGSNTIVKDSLITGNIALEDGGGLATGAQPATEQANAPTKIINTVINGNYALGLSWNTAAEGYRNWSIVADDTKGKGGGLLLHQYAEVKSSTIVDNFAPKGDNVYMTGGLLKNTAVYSTYSYDLWASVLSSFDDKLKAVQYVAGDATNGWVNSPGDYSALNDLLTPYLPSLSLQRSGQEHPSSSSSKNSDSFNYTIAQEFKHFIIPSIKARGEEVSSFVDIAIDNANADTIKANIQNSAFKTVALSDGENQLTGLVSSEAIQAIGQDNLVYESIAGLFNDEAYTAIESSFERAVTSFGLPLYVPKDSSTAPLAAAAQLAAEGTKDYEVLRDYYGNVRGSQDIGAFTSVLGCLITYQAGTTESVENLPEQMIDTVARGGTFGTSEATPTREGYKFAGWQADDDSQTVYQNAAEIKNVSADMTLTAQW